MTVMLTEVDWTNTTQLLEAVMRVVVPGERVQFLVPRQSGVAVSQRLRVMLSRKRKELEAQEVKLRRFRLNSDIYPFTDRKGTRFDCVVMWSSRSIVNECLEILEDKFHESL